MITGTGALHAPGPRFRPEASPVWELSGKTMDLSAPLVMGILNLTPDSFSDGGMLHTLDQALTRAREMVREGAGLLDVGGESTRPGAAEVPPEEELARILPFVEAARGEVTVPLSVDTRNAATARACLRAGAQMVNDVSGLRHDPEMARVVAEEEAGLVLSHMRGTPATMRGLAVYQDVVGEVVEELGASLELALEAGIPRNRIVLDPGIGFAKSGPQSLRLLAELDALTALGRPILVGPSRKSFIGELTGAPPERRGPGTLAACVLALHRGARIFRVHEVEPAVQALTVAEAILASDLGAWGHR